jgi:hypothetical protein
VLGLLSETHARGDGVASSGQITAISRAGPGHPTDPHALDPHALLYGSEFGPAPEYPVLWVSTGASVAPFGEVIAYRREGAACLAGLVLLFSLQIKRVEIKLVGARLFLARRE